MLEGMSDNFFRVVTEHPRECFIGPQYAMVAVGNAEPVGRSLKHLFEVFEMAVGFGRAVHLPGWRHGRSTGCTRSVGWRRSNFRRDECRWGSALQSFLQPPGARQICT